MKFMMSYFLSNVCFNAPLPDKENYLHLLTADNTYLCTATIALSIFPLICSDPDDHLDQSTEQTTSTSYVGNEQLFSVFASSKITRTAINEIMSVLRNYTIPQDIRKLPADWRTVVGKHQTPAIECSATSQYSYFGIERALRIGIADFDHDKKTLELHIMVDGLPLFNSSNKCFWPILGRFEEKKIFLIALFYGTSKPENSNIFLKDFVWECCTLTSDGIQDLVGRNYNFHLKCIHVDEPARSFILNIKPHNAYSSCPKCTVRGTHFAYFEHRRYAIRVPTNFSWFSLM